MRARYSEGRRCLQVWDVETVHRAVPRRERAAGGRPHRAGRAQTAATAVNSGAGGHVDVAVTSNRPSLVGRLTEMGMPELRRRHKNHRKIPQAPGFVATRYSCHNPARFTSRQVGEGLVQRVRGACLSGLQTDHHAPKRYILRLYVVNRKGFLW